ncbi:hypothetical protein M8J76_016166 [Diaphorina citri]|nr:hypothetical protein M8J76_016166 [Diaphorina citri]KAI5754969.1 hypothetical protein M8J77_013025 [Diaphorina citri]
MQIGLEFYVIYRNRYNLIELVNEMKCKFSTVDEKIVKECTRKENVFYWTFTGLVTIAASTSLLEPVFFVCEERIARKAKLYRYKYPQRNVPANIYIPLSWPIDLSEQPFYFFYMITLFYVVIYSVLLSSFSFTLMWTFAIHIKGQYDILLKYISQIKTHGKGGRNRKYYINIVTGDYFMRLPTMNGTQIAFCSSNWDDVRFKQERGVLDEVKEEVIGQINESVEHLESKQVKWHTRKAFYKMYQKHMAEYKRDGFNTNAQNEPPDVKYNEFYEVFFLRQIIQYHQFLLDFRRKIQNFLQPSAISTCFMFISLVAIDLQLTFTSEYKVGAILALVALIIYLASLVKFSDAIERANAKVQYKLFFETAWYEKSSRFKALIRVAIMRCNRSEHFTFHSGFMAYDRPLLLSLFSKTYKFCNWLFYVEHKKKRMMG